MAKQLHLLKDYYEKLLVWEKVQPCELISEWPKSLIASAEAAIGAAFVQSAMKAAHLVLLEGSENQSIGNQVAVFFHRRISPVITDWLLSPCSGPGYPDLIMSQGAHRVALEVKATSEWDPNDSNRIVLTSSSRKLRACFQPPIYHLLATVEYSGAGSDLISIRALRLDFLSPITAVNIRFEGSVSQKLLSAAGHHTAYFG